MGKLQFLGVAISGLPSVYYEVPFIEKMGIKYFISILTYT